MPLFHIVILAIIQGITEFLPISSSGHLILLHKLLGSDGLGTDQIMDIAVHVGTLFAVFVYFHRDLLRMAKAGAGRKMMLIIVVASLPAIAAGYAVHVFAPTWRDSIVVMGWTFIIFGILMGAADRFRPRDKTLADMTWKRALFIGLAQALSLVPGTSRSGITMTAARYLGFERVEAARFSLFLGIVAISGAGALGGLELLKADNAALSRDALIAACVSFTAGLGAISFMMRWLSKSSFTPFVIYRIILGVILLTLAYSGAA